MKKHIISILGVFLTTTVFSAVADPVFMKRKDYALQLAQKRFDIVQTEKSCLEKSTNGDELNSCKTKTKASYEALKEEFASMRKEYLDVKEKNAPVPVPELKEEVPTEDEQEAMPGFDEKTTNNGMVKPLRPRGGDIKDAKRPVPQKAIKL